jgi:hypothetical protein
MEGCGNGRKLLRTEGVESAASAASNVTRDGALLAPRYYLNLHECQCNRRGHQLELTGAHCKEEVKGSLGRSLIKVKELCSIYDFLSKNKQFYKNRIMM